MEFVDHVGTQLSVSRMMVTNCLIIARFPNNSVKFNVSKSFILLPFHKIIIREIQRIYSDNFSSFLSLNMSDQGVTTNVFAANVIWVLHMLFVVWMVVTPFTNNEPNLVLHLFVGPFLWFHWIMNEDACSLTLMEMKLRGIQDCKESFFHHVVSPIYKPRDEDIRVMAWMASIGLWLVTLSKVLKRPQMIGDMFKTAWYGHPPPFPETNVTGDE